MAHAHRERESDRLCWGKTVCQLYRAEFVSHINPRNAVYMLCCCVLYLGLVYTAARTLTLSFIMRNTFFAWVPDGKKKTKIRPSGFLLRQNSPNAMKKKGKFTARLPRRSHSSRRERNNIYSQFKALCEHRSSSRLQTAADYFYVYKFITLYRAWLASHYIRVAGPSSFLCAVYIRARLLVWNLCTGNNASVHLTRVTQ